jgi:simple sugar transport system permease protein
MGAWGAALVGLHWEGPTILVIPVMILAAAITGGLWAFGPALAKAALNINEVVTTLLLNFVAVQWVIWWSTDMWRDPNLGTLSATPRIAAEIPRFPGAITLHMGILIPLALVAIFAVVFRKSIWGYEVDLTGGNPSAASFTGIPVARRIVAVLVLSGAIAGISGMIQVTGSVHRLSGTLENQYGISGFMVAALAGASFAGLLGVGFFVAFLLHSGIVLSTQAGGITVNLVLAIYGSILLAVGVAEFATRYRLIFVKPDERAPPDVGSEPGAPAEVPT